MRSSATKNSSPKRTNQIEEVSSTHLSLIANIHLSKSGSWRGAIGHVRNSWRINISQRNRA